MRETRTTAACTLFSSSGKCRLRRRSYGRFRGFSRSSDGCASSEGSLCRTGARPDFTLHYERQAVRIPFAGSSFLKTLFCFSFSRDRSILGALEVRLVSGGPRPVRRLLPASSALRRPPPQHGDLGPRTTHTVKIGRFLMIFETITYLA